MPESAGSIYASVSLKLNKLDKGIGTVKSKLNGMVKDSQKKSGGFASFWKNAFQTAFGFGIINLINKATTAIRGALDVFSGFQQSMRNVQSVTGAVGEEFRLMEEAAKEAGEITRFTARQAADALYYLGSAGFSAQQSIDALDGVLQLAGATQSDLASTSETVASIISQYSLQASDATKVSNIFAAAIGNSQATMEKLSNSFRQVGPVAAGFGMSVEQTVGALQELYNAGFQGQMAGRALKSALADLASPTANIEKILSKYNISLDSVNPATNDLVNIIDRLAESGMTTADIIDAFGKVAGPQMAVLIEQGSDALQKYTDDVTGTQAAAEAYQIQNDSLAGSLDFLRSKLEGTAIAIFEKLEPGMRKLIDNFIQFLEATRPVSELLGNILNVFFQLASFSTKLITNIFDTLLKTFRDSETPMERFTRNFDDVRDSITQVSEIDQAVSKLEKLTNEYENLSSKASLTKDEQNRLRTVISQIERIVPGAVTKFDEYGNAIEISGEKSREAAKKMLESRKAIIMYSKAQLELLKPQLEDLIKIKNEELNQLEKEVKGTEEVQAITRARYVLLQNLRTEFENLANSTGAYGDATMGAFAGTRDIIQKYQDDLRKLGITQFDVFTGDYFGASPVFDALDLIEKQLVTTENEYNRLNKNLKERLDIKIEIQDAQKKLNELAMLEEELKTIENEMGNLNKTTEDVSGKTEEFNKKSNDFWSEYRQQLEEATREARLFGGEQDVLKASLDFLKNTYLELIEQGMDPASETLQRLRQEYDLTLMELQTLNEAEKERTENLKEQAEINKSVNDMTADYYQKLQDLDATEKGLIENERNRALASVYASGASEEAIARAVEAINLYYDKLLEKSEEVKEEIKITFEDILNYAAELSMSLIALQRAQTEARLEEIDRRMQAELEAAGLAEETEKERLKKELAEAQKAGDKEREEEAKNSLKKLEIQEKYEREAALIKYRGAMAEWRLKLAGVIATNAQAISKAVASAPWPVSLPAIAFATVQGVIQLATVNAQKPNVPKFQTGGVFLGPDEQYRGQDVGGTPAMLHNNEMILNADQMKNLFDMINSGERNNGAYQGQGMSITVIMELDGTILYKGVEKAQNNGIIRFKANRLI